jgi:hypothetical protein
VPIARYFIFVGGTLLALLFIADSYLPNSPSTFAVHQHGIDRTIKMPDRLVFIRTSLNSGVRWVNT